MTRLLLIRLVAPVLGRAPAIAYPLAAVLGAFAWYLLPRRRRILSRNMLPLCNGNRRAARRAGRRAYQQVARYWIDLMTLPHRNLATFESEHTEVYGVDRLLVLDEPGPIVVVSAHTGNAELVIQALTYRGRPFLALVETLRPRAFAHYLLRLRSVAGGQFHEASFAGVRASIETLKAGGLVGVMADRDIQHTGVPAELCGRTVRLPRGAWELARRCDAVVLPVLTARRGAADFDVFVEEPFRVARSSDPDADIQEAVERWAIILERHLRRDPSQWAVLEDFWRVHGVG